MSEPVPNEWIHEVLKRVQSGISEIPHELRELRHRVALTELHMTGVQAGVQMLNERGDRLHNDLQLIKRRLDVVDA
jgi:hypothetical protein